MFDEDKADRNYAFRITNFLKNPAIQHFLENLNYKYNTLTRELKKLDGMTITA